MTPPVPLRLFRSLRPPFSTFEITGRWKQRSESEFHTGGVSVSRRACQNKMRLRQSKLGFTSSVSRADDESHNLGFEDPDVRSKAAAELKGRFAGDDAEHVPMLVTRCNIETARVGVLTELIAL